MSKTAQQILNELEADPTHYALFCDHGKIIAISKKKYSGEVCYAIDVIPTKYYFKTPKDGEYIGCNCKKIKTDAHDWDGGLPITHQEFLKIKKELCK